MEENSEEITADGNNKLINDTSDNKPLALRKTPRSHAGINMYTRMENNNSPSSPSPRSKDSNVKKRSLTVTVNTVKENAVNTPSSNPKKKRKVEGQDYDHFCWLCHKEGMIVKCQVCPRSYHTKCLGYEPKSQDDWVCLECEKILQSENVDTQSKAMKMITIDQLCNLLKFTVNLMKQQSDEAFIKPVSVEQFPNYTDYIINPMDLNTLEKNIRKKMYGCTESFLADTKWILHNCIIFNGYQHRLTSSAKSIVKLCKQEMNEIEICPDCYLNAYTKKDNWFCEPCREPHVLIWAKLKGFPFWPAKAMRISNGNIDVRFFGAHDRAWIPVNQCFLLSRDIPTPMKNKKKGSFEQSMEELELHIKKLEEKFGEFHHALFRTRPDSENIQIHLSAMLPFFQDSKSNGIKKSRVLINSLSSNENMVATDMVETEKGSSKQTTIRQSSPGNVDSSKVNDLGESLTGVFETSDDTSEDIPYAELKIPKLDLSKLSKPRIQSIKNLESTIERIKESVTENCDDESDKCSNDLVKNIETEENNQELLNDERTKEHTPLENDENDSDSLNTTEREGVSQSCEVTSTTNMTDLNVDSAEGTSVNDRNSTTIPHVQKSSNIFSQKLDQIIESCKAKFGPENIQSEMAASEESEKEDADVNEEEEAEDDMENETINEVAECIKNSDNLKSPHEVENETIPDKLTVLESTQSVDKPDDNKKRKLESSPRTKLSIKRQLTGNEFNETDEDEEGEEEEEEMNEEENTEELNETQTQINIAHEEINDFSKSSDNCDKPNNNDNNLITTINNATSLITEKAMENSTKDIQKTNVDVMDTESDENNLIIDLDQRENDKRTSSVTNNEKKSRHISVKENRTEKKSHQNKTKSPAKERLNNKPTSSRNIRAIEPGFPPDVSASYQKGPITVINISSSPPQMVPKPMPTLQPRPVAIAQVSATAPPSSPGPGCDMNKYSRKMMDFMRGTFEEMFRDMAKSGNLEASVKLLQLELEKLQWRHQQELAEIKHNTDLILLEMRASMESEKQRAIADVRRQCELEKQKSIEETKKKQWCSNCGKEAIFYCCWNTSYCDYPCQQAHWPQHMSMCAQSQTSNESESQEIPSVTPNTSGGTNQMTSFSSTNNYSAPIHRTVSHPQVPVDIASRRDNIQEQWQKQKDSETSSLMKNHQEERERDKQRNKINMPHSVSQGATLPAQYTPALGPSIQYIPSNAVQVIPQTSSIANSAALQVQYVTNIPSQSHSLAMSTSTSTIPQFATMTSAGAQQHNHRILAPQQQQRNPMQMSNPVYPIIIQPSQLGMNQNASSPSSGRLYPRGPYIPGKPYHIS